MAGTPPDHNRSKYQLQVVIVPSDAAYLARHPLKVPAMKQ